jgi:hypothetical protein
MRVLCLAFGSLAATAQGDILARIEALEANNARLEAKNTEITDKYLEMQHENTEIRAVLNGATAGELKIFNANECPPGWVEFNKTQGYLLTGRPKGGETGATINRPMDAGETGRSPQHSHEVAINDPGHNHVNTVNDPGHAHAFTIEDHGGSTHGVIGPSGHGVGSTTTRSNKTGIIVDSLPAESNIQVSLTSNEDGESYPLVYVLICQRVFTSN